MKKILIAGLALCALCSASFAWGKKKASKEQIVLTVLDYQDATSPNSFDDNKLVWDRFMAENPDIKIEREALFNEPFHQKTAAYAASGKMPDVFYMWPAGRSTSIHEQHLAKDLLPLLKKDKLTGDYNPTCIDPANEASGYLAEIPIGLTTTHVMYVNKDVLKKCGLSIPKSYDELKAQVPVLKANGYECILMANMDDWVMQSCLFSMVCGRFGGKDWATNILKGKDKFTGKAMLNAVSFIKKMYDDGVLSQKTLATSYGDVVGLFASEKGAYLIDGDRRSGAFITDQSTKKALISPEKQESAIDLMIMPAIPGEVLHDSNSSVLGVGYGMSSSIKKGSAKEQAAWRLLKWLNGPVVQQRRLDTGASYPSLIKGIVYDKNKMEPILIKRGAFYESQKNPTPVFDSVFDASVASACNTNLQALGLGKVTPMQVCQAMQTAYDEWKAAN
jgi:raffinose/stachyose/melibiose transport system substrate-binding protein